MTTNALIARSCLYTGLVFAVVAGFVLSCAGTSAVRYGDRVDVSKYPKDIQEAYSVFAVKCSKCHTLARPLNARIRDPEHWVRYVTRMRRNPSSGINAKDAETILRFLLYYTQQVEAEEEGTSNAPEPSVVASPPPLSSEGRAAPEPPAPAPGNPAGLEEPPMTEPARPAVDGGTP